MADACCRLVGNLDVIGCSISISINSSTEIIKECGNDILTGATTGTLSLNSYTGSPSIYTGCAQSAQLSIPWIRKYDCDADVVYFINSGKGTSTIIGDPDNASIPSSNIVKSYPNLNASIGSGPSNPYSLQTQYNGYGLIYSGGPINFDSRNANTLIIPFTNIVSEGVPSGASNLYLQSFSLNYSPGELPTANYSFAFSVS